jgi:hypothetical protein
MVSSRRRFRAFRAMWIGTAACLLMYPPSVRGQSPTPLARVRASGLDGITIGRVSAFSSPADRAYATGLATLADAAAAYFEAEFGGTFPLYLAVLGPDEWFDPYMEGTPAPYGMPWGWIPESLMAVPASLDEGVLIQGPDRAADLRRVRFVMLHEFGHLVAKKYLHPESQHLYSSVRWFEELIATYFAYAFVSRTDPAWARAGRLEWAAFVQRDPPASATLDWRFMANLPPEQFGRTYAWYQNLLNVRAADLYAEHGMDFLRDLRDQLVWTSSDEWTSDALLNRLESFAPGFQAWAAQLEQGRYLDGPPYIEQDVHEEKDW